MDCRVWECRAGNKCRVIKGRVDGAGKNDSEHTARGTSSGGRGRHTDRKLSNLRAKEVETKLTESKQQTTQTTMKDMETMNNLSP